MSETTQDTSGIVFPPPLIYALGFAIGYGLHRLRPVALVPGDGVPRKVIGWVLVAACAALTGSALYVFRRAGTSPIPIKPTTALVVRGPYQFTRNPMYLAFAALYLSLTLFLNALWPLLLFPLVIALVQRRVIAREEAYLERTFGDEYRAYKGRVRRWL